jgi:prepilin-type N-terminal cleavage/methylation domain-containing protein
MTHATNGYFKKSGGFTLIELIFVVFLVGVLLSVLFPHIESALDQAHYMDCESRQEIIKRAKSAYVLDHMGSLGMGTNAGLITNANDQAVLRSYLVTPFAFTCPRSGQSYNLTNIYDVYSSGSICPYCATNVPMGVIQQEN